MFVPIDDYFNRIYYTLENVIAPDLESDFARGQVYAIIVLLGSLCKKIEYKHELILEEINTGTDIIAAIIKVLKDAGIETPGEVLSFMKEFEKIGPCADITYMNKVNDNFRCAMDCFYENRKMIEPDTLTGIDKQIRSYIHDISLRDVGFMVATSFDKIMKSGKEGKEAK